MADSFKKIIRLSRRLQMPVVMYNPESEEAAVVMDVDVFERRESEMTHGCCMDDADEDFSPDEINEETGENRNTSQFEESEMDREEREFQENMAFYQSQKSQSDSFAEDFQSAPWNNPIQAAHELHHPPQSSLSWNGNPKEIEEDVRYEPTSEKALFPAFTPEGEDDSDEEPIFFEEPV